MKSLEFLMLGYAMCLGVLAKFAWQMINVELLSVLLSLFQFQSKQRNLAIISLPS
jgi:hypothetical protein